MNTKIKVSIVFNIRALWLNAPFFGSFVALLGLTGIVMYAYFHECDPILDGQIEQTDQVTLSTYMCYIYIICNSCYYPSHILDTCNYILASFKWKHVFIQKIHLHEHSYTYNCNVLQMIPLMVMELLGQYPGVAGLFLAALCSAALR